MTPFQFFRSVNIDPNLCEFVKLANKNGKQFSVLELINLYAHCRVKAILKPIPVVAHIHHTCAKCQLYIWCKQSIIDLTDMPDISSSDFPQSCSGCKLAEWYFDAKGIDKPW